MQKNIENDRYLTHHRYDNDISKKPILKTPIRYDTDNIGIADIIDDTDTIDPSLVQISCVDTYGHGSHSSLYATAILVPSSS